MEPEEDIKISLLENGLDFICSALEHLEGHTSDREFKYAVIHLAAGIELILKEKLRQTNWELVFNNPTKANRRAYETGDFSSVKFDDCLERLESDVGVTLDGRQKEDLKALRRKRNRIEHFNILDTPEAIRSSTARGLSALLDFVASEIPPHTLSVKERTLLKEIRQKTSAFEFFIDQRLDEVTPQLEEHGEKGKTVVTCPSCKQGSLVINDDLGHEVGAHCYFCRYWNVDPIATASEYVANVQGINYGRFTREGGKWPQSQCPSCEWETLVDEGDEGYLCFQCGASWDLGILIECCSCGEPFEDEEGGIGMCSQCFVDRVKGDD